MRSAGCSKEAGGSLDDLLDMLSFHRDARGMEDARGSDGGDLP